MTAEYYWTLPTRGDGRGVADVFETRARCPRGLGPWSHQSVTSGLGATATWTIWPTSLGPPQSRDSTVCSFHSTLRARTPGSSRPRWPGIASLAFVTEFPPTFGTPVYAAKMSTTFQRFSGGRLGWKLAVEDEHADGRSFGDHVEGSDRFVRAGEFLDVATGIWGHEGFTFKGRFFEVEEGGLRHPLSRYPRPAVALSGATPEALALSATHGDVHLWESPRPHELEQHKRELDRLASSQGRHVRHGVQLTVVARETPQEAWDEVRRLWRHAGAGNQEEFERLVLAPDLWSGFRLIGQHATAGVVGSYEQVASYLRSVREAGIEVFYLGASPPLEEAYRFGEHVVPLLVAEPAQLQAV